MDPIQWMIHSLVHAVSWAVHPLGGIVLAFLAANMFSVRRRQQPFRYWALMIGAAVMVLLLTALGADWLVHPVAGLTLALLASVAFHAWQREWKTILAALLALMITGSLGADWAIYPLLGLGMAWLIKVIFSGELLRPGEFEMHGLAAAKRPAVATFAAPAALPAQGGGEVFVLPDRVAVRTLHRLDRKRAKLERKAERLGFPLRVQTPVAPLVMTASLKVPEAQPAAISATDLFTLSRDERLPADARAKLGALHFRCREASAYLKEHDQNGAGQPEARTGFLLGQIETDYAPEAVGAYLKLPPSLAAVTPLQDGKTGKDLLLEQLDLLLNAVQNIMQDVTQAGSQRLLAHQRFLQDRFAEQQNDLKL